MPKRQKIEARLATKVVGDLRLHGVNADSLLKEVGLRRADVADPDARVPYAAVLGLIERAATTLGDVSYGLRLGAASEARDNGLLGFVVMNSPTLLDAVTVRVGINPAAHTINLLLGKDAWQTAEVGKEHRLKFVFDGFDPYIGTATTSVLSRGYRDGYYSTQAVSRRNVWHWSVTPR